MIQTDERTEDYFRHYNEKDGVPPGNYLDPRTWLAGLVKAILRPRVRGFLADWIERFVSIPEESGSPNPGPLRLARFPVFRGLYDLVQKQGVHYFTFCASARVGKTLFSICVLLWWISEKFGPAVWLDPTRKSAIKFVRTELDAFLLQCQPVKALAIISKKTWTTLEKQFRGKFLRIIGSGAEADLHGFQAAFVCINESDRCRQSIDRDATSADKIIARTRQFAHSRLILRNSTPTEELGDVWQAFLRGSQHYCYVGCPHCRVKQRLTFSSETKEVPFDLAGKPLPEGQTRTEKTGYIRFDQFAIYQEKPVPHEPGKMEQVKIGYDIDACEMGATYRCAHCDQDIEWVDINQMLTDYEWRAHNLAAPRDHISAHIWAAYSPFEFWGIIAKEFLESKGSLAKLIKFETLTKGMPFIRHASAIKEDDLERVIKRTPVRYVQGQIPMEAELLTMTVDVQGEQFFWVIRAWGILWDHPDRPTWNALVDWGEAVSWDQILEMGGLTPMHDGTVRTFIFRREDDTTREYNVTSGLIDSGFEAETNKKVYEFCLAWQHVFSPYKGGDQSKTRGALIRLSPIMDDQIDLIWAWSDYFAAALYYSSLRDGRNSIGDLINWWLPIDIDSHYRKQLCSERQVEENGKRVWKAFGDNHLGDCEKMQEVLRATIEERLDDIRADIAKTETNAVKSAEEEAELAETIRDRVRKLTLRSP